MSQIKQGVTVLYVCVCVFIQVHRLCMQFSLREAHRTPLQTASH